LSINLTNGEELELLLNDADACLIALCQNMHADFPELLLHEALKLQVGPIDRKNKFDLLLFKTIAASATTAAGVSYARSYSSLCRYHHQSVRTPIVEMIARLDATLPLGDLKALIEAPLDWRPLLEALRYTRRIRHVTARDTRLPADAVAALTLSLAASRHVRAVSFRRLSSTADALPSLCEALASGFVTLTHIDIAHTSLGDKGVTALAKAWVARRWPLRVLRLRHVDAGAHGMTALFTAMRTAAEQTLVSSGVSIVASLAALDVGGNAVDARCSTLIGEFVRQ
jgi:hypothetical protein